MDPSRRPRLPLPPAPASAFLSPRHVLSLSPPPNSTRGEGGGGSATLGGFEVLLLQRDPKMELLALGWGWGGAERAGWGLGACEVCRQGSPGLCGAQTPAPESGRVRLSPRPSAPTGRCPHRWKEPSGRAHLAAGEAQVPGDPEGLCGSRQVQTGRPTFKFGCRSRQGGRADHPSQEGKWKPHVLGPSRAHG